MRTCPHCGHSEESSRERCSNCGRSVLATPPRLQGRRRAQAIWAGTVLGLAAVVAIAVLLGNSVSARDARQARSDAQRVVAERARLIRLQAPHRGAAPDVRPAPGASRTELLRARAALRARVEAAITADARARAARGELAGPITRTACGPLLRDPRAIPDDRVLTKAVGRYDCLAVERMIVGGGGDLGYPFVAALDFKRYTFVWCRNTPAQSERGQALAFVRLDRACLAAKGRALGTGYVDVPGS
ncbi:MAG: hypothetical protein ACXVFL_14765 [Solirubrobacteraceae bacterium]